MKPAFGIGTRDTIYVFFLPNASTGDPFGLRLIRIGHQHGIPAGDGRWEQTFAVVAQPSQVGSGPQTVRANITWLEEHLRRAKDYHNAETGERESIWLHEGTHDETGGGTAGNNYGARRALIYDYEIREQVADTVRTPLLEVGNDDLWVATISITRGAWESGGIVSVSAPTEIGCNADTWTFSSDGTIPGRIEKFSFQPKNNALYRYWIGMRDQWLGTYNSRHLIQDATVTDLSGDSANAWDDDVGNNVLQTSFGSGEDLSFRWTKAASNPHYLVGKHLVLMMSRVTTADTVIRTRFSTSFKSPGDAAGSGTYTYNFLREEEITGIDWHLHELGVIQIPGSLPRKLTLDNMTGTNVYFNVEAERLSGSGYLRTYYLYLLPAERRLFIDHAPTAPTDTLTIFTTPDGQVEVHIKDASGNVEVPVVDPYNWRVPLVGGSSGPLLVFAAEQQNFHDVADEIDNITFQYYPTWRTYRDD